MVEREQKKEQERVEKERLRRLMVGACLQFCGLSVGQLSPVLCCSGQGPCIFEWSSCCHGEVC